jgi:hypothetical protein
VPAVTEHVPVKVAGVKSTISRTAMPPQRPASMKARKRIA